MESILEELFYGNINPNTEYRDNGGEAKKLIAYIADYYDNLFDTLDERQKEMLEKFNNCFIELTGISEREMFIQAFRLGMKIAIEVLAKT